jgi:UDP-N-acetylglucosamine 2-epimerase (non-hydrolysing)
MSHIFKKLDENFTHILINTGQHYDKMLSEVFFDELNIRKPNYTLSTGKDSANHYEQLSYLAKAIPDLLKSEQIHPDLILFLGDSNTASVAMALKKQGYTIGHIEAGMRSFDNRMLEEINRKVCDMCSDILFVYHNDYAKFLEKEGITKNVYVVGNTIVEPTNDFRAEIMREPKKNSCILVDIHRPENFEYKYRLESILSFAEEASKRYNLPVKLLYFKRLEDSFKKFSLEYPTIEMVPLMSYKQYLQTIYNCPFIISDSGTGQEEPALLNTPVVVPREYTERPMSYTCNCSKQFRVAEYNSKEIFSWLDRFQAGTESIDTSWLGNGTTSQQIIDILKDYLK